MTTIEATFGNPVSVYYCKAGIASGKTVRVQQGAVVHATAQVEILDARASMFHDNSSGKAKRSGARCVLIITKGTIQFSE